MVYYLRELKQLMKVNQTAKKQDIASISIVLDEGCSCFVDSKNERIPKKAGARNDNRLIKCLIALCANVFTLLQNCLNWLKRKGATVKSHPLNSAFEHGVTAWRLVTRSALSNFVIVRRIFYHNGGRYVKCKP